MIAVPTSVGVPGALAIIRLVVPTKFARTKNGTGTAITTTGALSSCLITRTNYTRPLRGSRFVTAPRSWGCDGSSRSRPRTYLHELVPGLQALAHAGVQGQLSLDGQSRRQRGRNSVDASQCGGPPSIDGAGPCCGRRRCRTGCRGRNTPMG